MDVTPQAAFADYLRSTAIDLWEINKGDSYAAALDDLALAVDTLEENDPDAEYLGRFVKDGHFEPDALFDQLLHRITLNERTDSDTDRQFVEYLIHHHRNPIAEEDAPPD